MMTPAPQEQVLFFKIASNYRVNMKLTIQLTDSPVQTAVSTEI